MQTKPKPTNEHQEIIEDCQAITDLCDQAIAILEREQADQAAPKAVAK